MAALSAIIASMQKLEEEGQVRVMAAVGIMLRLIPIEDCRVVLRRMK
jgi:hypothetical protein